MHEAWVGVIIVGLVANADNFGVGLAYGVRRRRIGLGANLLVAVLTTAVTLIALWGGHVLRAFLPLDRAGAAAGALLIVLSILGFLWGSDDPTADAGPARVGLAEAGTLAVALSLNNIGLAIAGGLGGLGFAPVAAAVFLFSLLLLGVGQSVGGRAGRSTLSAANAARIGNALLALAGVWMLVD